MEIYYEKYYKTFNCFQDGYSFSRSPPRATLDIEFLNYMEFCQVQGEVDDVE